jgi:hypothetical protein
MYIWVEDYVTDSLTASSVLCRGLRQSNLASAFFIEGDSSPDSLTANCIQLLQSRLEDLRQGVDIGLGELFFHLQLICSLRMTFARYAFLVLRRFFRADDKEFVGGGLLDSLNFTKQDENYAPPKVKSGSVAQAMLSKVAHTLIICLCTYVCRMCFL